MSVIINCLTVESSLELSSGHVYSDPHFPDDSPMWEKDKCPASSDGESNYSDGEIWLCKKQKKLSQRSRKLNLEQKSGGCNKDLTVDKSFCANSGNDVPDVLSPREEENCNHQMEKYVYMWLVF